jgi:DNA-binding MurR/RpiR family transcriptional regulator
MPKLRSQIQSVLPSLTAAERRIAQVVLDDSAAAGLTITELADLADTSPSSVVRFCRVLGLRGYPELRLTLASEAGRAEAEQRPEFGSDIGAGDDLAEVIAKIGFADAAAVEQTVAQLDVAALGRVVTAIDAARSVLVFGMAASSVVAADLQLKLERIGLTVSTTTDPHLALMKAALLDERDVALVISHSGTTVEVIETLAEARSRGARTIAVTNFPKSPVCAHADDVLTTVARETTFRSGAMASRIAQLTVVDCVFIGVAQRRYDEATAALKITRDAVVRRRDKRRRPS